MKANDTAGRMMANAGMPAGVPAEMPGTGMLGMRVPGTLTRHAAWMFLAAVALATNTGCLIPMYSGDPVRRAEQLIYTSEDLRAITDEWERIWFLDQPSHMTPYRTHGGIL